MAYSTNPNLPRARAIALRLLIVEALPLQVVANRCGVHRSTVWRWKRKWAERNAHVQFENHNRPQRRAGKLFRLTPPAAGLFLREARGRTRARTSSGRRSWNGCLHSARR
jgi:transposase-like protein